MKYILIGVIILAFIAGGFAWYLKREEASREGVLSGALKSMGVKTKESIYAQRRRELMERVARQHDDLKEHIRDQQEFLERSQEQLKSMSERTQEILDKSQVDLLRVKEVMADLKERNRLMIENGKQLLALNKEQMALRTQMKDNLDLNKVDNIVINDRLETFLNDRFVQHENFLKQSLENNDYLRGQTMILNYELKQNDSQIIRAVDSPLGKNMRDIETMNQNLMDNVENNQQKLKDKMNQGRELLQSLKERSQDMMNAQDSRLANTKELMEERKRVQDERTQGQLEQLKQLRERLPSSN